MARTMRNAMLIEGAWQEIRTTQLVNRLQNHALGNDDMTPSQVAEKSLGTSCTDKGTAGHKLARCHPAPYGASHGNSRPASSTNRSPRSRYGPSDGDTRR
jgi:hypothetical protein